jgi:uncharacterized protein (TIGR01777 family)
MANILITGGSGLVGRAISEQLLQRGHQVSWLSRSEDLSGRIKKYKWTIEKEFIDERAFEGIQAIIHLAGAGIVDKAWTESYKKELLDSRVKSSELVFKYVRKKNITLKSFVGGSAVGYYGSINSGHIYSEGDLPGSDFLSRTSILWEKSYDPFQNEGIRTVIIRTGIVLSKQGGAYRKLKLLFQFGLGSPIGDGKQAFPWIHIDDLAAIFVKALFDESMQGIYNGVSSEQVNNSQFSKALAQSFKRPFFLPNIPAALMRLVMGERAITITNGVKVGNTKIKQSGFEFKFIKVADALKELAS